MKSPSVSEPGGLTFAWLHRPRLSLALPGFLLLSLLVHALTFYVFQVAYPPPVTVAPPPVQVNVLAPTSLEKQELLRWIESEDPAAIANPQEVSPGSIRDVIYQPSFATVRTAPKTFGEKQSTVHFPPTVNSAALIESNQKQSAAVPRKNGPQQTELRFSGALAGRKITTRPALKLDAGNIANPGQTGFFVGVNSDGAIQYVFLQNSSGDEGLDRQAEKHLSGFQFARAAGGVTWGFVTFFWGDDVRASAPPSASPTITIK
jgi:hypothetical protein